MLTKKRQLAEFLVENHVVFVKHRLDVGFNLELMVKMMPDHPPPVYVQGPPAPVPLCDEVLIELALLKHLIIITTLSRSKHNSPIFFHRKSSGRLSIFFDLRRVNHLRHGYLNGVFPISTMTNPTNHRW